MKWKITFKYVITIILVVVIVTSINFIALIAFISGSQKSEMEQPEEIFTRSFQKYINNDMQNIYINENGKKELNNRDSWVQILDENGKEVYNYNKPKGLNEKHTPMELIHGYKYAGGLSKSNADNILVGDKVINNTQYTYIIGFGRNSLSKVVFMYNPYSMMDTLFNVSSIILRVDIIIAIIFGYIFSRRLIKPMKTIINGVENLEDGKYEIYYKEKGLYKDVYKKLNNLSDTLKINEIERTKTDNMRQEWIANISHDIKTPLSSIKGYAELLSEDYEFSNEEIIEYGKIINNKSEYIKELVDDLNLTMKLKNNTSILDKKESNLVSVVRDAVIGILNDPKYSNRDVEFISEENVIKKDIDTSLIKRVINNLLYNALVHNSEDIKVVVEIYKKEKIYIEIKDNGKGIKKDDIQYIFERYYRGTNTGELHKGSGLGMAIAKEIIVAHGGEINIESQLGKGTNVQIIL